MASNFKSWYENPENKAAYNARRAAKYKADPAMRQRAREYQANYRANNSGPKTEFNGLTREQVCDDLGITPWVFNSWRTKGYFPEPSKVGGRVCLTEQQKSLIGLLADFHQSHGPRLSSAQKAVLDRTIETVHQNWSA